jgi:Kdo2-lipid IVA lauroyltransferase/acyltransferase
MGGRSGILKRAKNTTIYGVVRSGLAVFRTLGFRRSLGAGRALGRLAFRLAARERERTLAHLALAFPELDPAGRRRLARQVFEHLGTAVAECVNVRKVDLATYVEIDPASGRRLDEILARGRGVVFVTGHCGNWELMARRLAQAGYPINTIGQKSYDPRFTRLIADFRSEGRVHTVWRGEPRILEKMLEVLAHQEIMGLLIDQDTKVPGVFVPFFGRAAYTPTAPALLARKARAPMVCGFNHRKDDGGLRIVLEEIPASPEADLERAVAADTRALSACIERHIRAHPAEWVWMHRRWKTQP